MIGLTKLTKKQIEVLRQMVLFTCEICHKHEDEVGTLEPHRLIRAEKSGKYIPRNIQMCCKGCHRTGDYPLHGNEFRNVKSK